GRVLVLELGMLGVTEVGVLVERDLAVERLELVALESRERVDLDERGVLLDEDLPQREDRLDGLVHEDLGELGVRDDLASLGLVDAGARIDLDLADGLGVGLRNLLDLDTALDRRDRQVAA